MTQRQAHFIRCIKPTTTLKPGNFTPALVLQQLRCSGTIDAVQLMTSAYPTRIPYENIYSRYAQHMPDFVRALEPPLFCEALSLALEIPPSGYQLGRTKIFFKAGKGQILEELAERDISEVVPMLIEKIKQWEARKAAQVVLQTYCRMWLYRTKYRKTKASARKIQHARQSKLVFVEYKKRHIAWLEKRKREEAERKAREAEERRRKEEEERRRQEEEQRKREEEAAAAAAAGQQAKATAAARTHALRIPPLPPSPPVSKCYALQALSSRSIVAGRRGAQESGAARKGSGGRGRGGEGGCRCCQSRRGGSQGRSGGGRQSGQRGGVD